MIPLDEVLEWKEDLFHKALERFGRHGAHCNKDTYERLRRACIQKDPSPMFSHLAAVPLNSFRVHVKDAVPDGMLESCDCAEKDTK